MIIVAQLFLRIIRSLVKKNKADLGISLDGDADRIIICWWKRKYHWWRSNNCNVRNKMEEKKY